jgi:hypothetical protein
MGKAGKSGELAHELGEAWAAAFAGDPGHQQAVRDRTGSPAAGDDAWPPDPQRPRMRFGHRVEVDETGWFRAQLN